MRMFDRQFKAALIVAGATLVVFGVGFRSAVGYLNVYLTKLPVPLREPLSDLPRRLGPWESVDQDRQLTKEMVEQLGTDSYLDRVYVRTRSKVQQHLAVHIAYYTGMIDPIPHVPERCLVAAGFDQATLPQQIALNLDRTEWQQDPQHIGPTGEPYLVFPLKHYINNKPVQMFSKGEPMFGVRMPQGDLAIRAMEFQQKQAPFGHIIAGYFFIANGQATPLAESVRIKAFDMRQKHAYYCKIQFTMRVQSEQDTRQEFAARVSDLLNSMLPELMRCLPDWAEVEAGSVGLPSRQETNRT